jgi:hypothetical protein
MAICFENARLFLKIAWHFKDIFREFEAFFKDFRETEVFFNKCEGFSKQVFLKIFLVELLLF